MTHGLPDWYGVGRGVTVHSVLDMAELAVRLGAISSYDRRGNVHLAETFEHGNVRWTTVQGGTGASVGLSIDTFRSHGYSMKLVAGDAVDDYASLSTSISVVPAGASGVEISFSDLSDGACLYLGLNDFGPDGGYYPQLRYDVDSALLQIREGASSYTTLGSVNFKRDAWAWYNMKLVIDSINHTYIRAIFIDTEYDIRDYNVYHVALGLDPRLQPQVVVKNALGNSTEHVYIDNIIVTHNEPI